MNHTSPAIKLIQFADCHLPLFERWLSAEHVAPWFEHPQSWLAEVRGRRQEYQWIHHYIITSGSFPIGFCQYYPYWKSEETWHGTIPIEGTYSIDYLIGEEDCLAQGYAGKAIQILCEKMEELPDALRIIVQPDAKNQISRKTLLSAGFEYDKKNDIYIRHHKINEVR